MTRRYSAAQIVQRAQQLGILLSVEKDQIKIYIPRQEGVDITKIRKVVGEQKQELLAYLSQSQAHHLEPERSVDLTFDPDLEVGFEICSTCLDAGRETQAIPEDYDGVMYCREHHPTLQKLTHEQFLSIAERMAQVLGDCTITIDPPGYTIEDRVRELAEQAKSPKTQEDYWQELHEQLDAHCRRMAREGYVAFKDGYKAYVEREHEVNLKRAQEYRRRYYPDRQVVG